MALLGVDSVFCGPQSFPSAAKLRSPFSNFRIPKASSHLRFRHGFTGKILQPIRFRGKSNLKEEDRVATLIINSSAEAFQSDEGSRIVKEKSVSVILLAGGKGKRMGGSRIVKEKSVSVILLAGGKGKRMGASMPKQYLPLLGQPIALYSFRTFSYIREVKEVIVVCDPSYKDVFEETKERAPIDIKFALPGKERQDSVYSGLQEVDVNSELVCVHDSARPLVSSGDTKKVLNDGLLHGAAVLGVPVKATIKEAATVNLLESTI